MICVPDRRRRCRRRRAMLMNAAAGANIVKFELKSDYSFRAIINGAVFFFRVIPYYGKHIYIYILGARLLCTIAHDPRPQKQRGTVQM